MKTESIVKSLNLTAGDILTLEKAKDRIEFEALPVMILKCQEGPCPDLCSCKRGVCPDDDWCKRFCFIDACECTGPVGYKDPDQCRPFTVCPGNNCRPVQ